MKKILLLLLFVGATMVACDDTKLDGSSQDTEKDVDYIDRSEIEEEIRQLEGENERLLEYVESLREINERYGNEPERDGIIDANLSFIEDNNNKIKELKELLNKNNDDIKDDVDDNDDSNYDDDNNDELSLDDNQTSINVGIDDYITSGQYAYIRIYLEGEGIGSQNDIEYCGIAYKYYYEGGSNDNVQTWKKMEFPFRNEYRGSYLYQKTDLESLFSSPFYMSIYYKLKNSSSVVYLKDEFGNVNYYTYYGGEFTIY